MADLEDVTLDGRPLQSLRVADLKAALEERGLPKSGQKNALIKRLKGALMLENLQRTSHHHIGLQPNSQIGEEMSQNSFIKQYLAKQQELLRQRLEREAREAVEDDDTDQEDHTQGNNSSACAAPDQDDAPVLVDQHKPLGPSEGEGLAGPASEGEGHRAKDGHVSGPPASTSPTSAPAAVASLSVRVAGGGQRQERVPTSSQVPADSDDDSDGGDEDGEDEDWNSGARRRNLGEPPRGQLARERSEGSRQPPQHIPPLLSPQLRQPTPPPSPPPELSFPLPDTPKQSPPSPGELPARQRTSSTSSSGSSSSGSRSSSPEPQSNAERKPGPLTLLARKMASEGAFSGVGWHGRGEAERQDNNAATATIFPGRGPQEGTVSAITHTANAAASLPFPSLVPVTNQGVLGGHLPHSQVPVSVLRPTIMEERDAAWQQENKERELQAEREREKALEQERLRAVELERQRIFEQQRAMEQERERALKLEREEREKALEAERKERERALEQEREEREKALEAERKERERALERERAQALEREREEREKALVEEREKSMARERALELEKEKAMELERQRAMERERALQQEREERERAIEKERVKSFEREERERAREREQALERERLETARALQRERLEREKALDQERLEREKALELERQKALKREQEEREKALELERIEKEKALEQEREEREKALELERIEKEKALEQEREEREKALELERIEKELALEQERVEQEKALELERQKALEREREERARALEQERIEREKALDKERAMEKERVEREKALEREREEKERVLEQKALQREKVERESTLEQDKERAKVAERESHLPPWKRGREIGLTPLPTPPLSTGAGRMAATEEGGKSHVPSLPQTASRDNQPAESGTPLSPTIATPLSPQSSFKKFRFLRDPPVLSQSCSASLVIKRPRTFSDSPHPQASALQSPRKPGEQEQEGTLQGPNPSAGQAVPQMPARQGVLVSGPPAADTTGPETPVIATLGKSPEEEKAKELASEEQVLADKEETDKQEVGEMARGEKGVGAGNVPSGRAEAVVPPSPPPEEGNVDRGRERSQKKEEKRGRQASSSSDSSDSDSGSSSSHSSGSSSSSQGKTRTTPSGRKPEKPQTNTISQDKETVSQPEDSTEAPKAPQRKNRGSGEEEEKDMTIDGARHSKKPFLGKPAGEGNEQKKDSEREKEKTNTTREVKEAAMTEPERAPEGSEESLTPKTFAARRISLSSSKASPGVVSAEGEAESGAGPGRKRRWGSSTAVTAKKPSISLTTDSLKSLIPDIRLSPGQEAVVDLHPEETHLSGGEEDRERGEQDFKIRRTVTQVVLSETQENGPKESKRSEHKDEDREDGGEVKGDREKMDNLFQRDSMETQSPSPPIHDMEMNTVSPSDTLIRRSISQQKSGVSITIDDPVRTAKQPSPPRGKVSNIVHLSNLVRPFTLGQLKELLSRTGTMLEDGFWIDKIKSHCYVTYSIAEEAVATRAALHGVKWPQSNPKFLSVDFSQQEELDFHRGLPPPERAGEEERGAASMPGRGRGVALPPLLPESDQWAEREREMERRERTRAEREWDRDKVRDFGPGKPGEEAGPRRSRSRERKRKEMGKSKERKMDKKEKAPEEPPAKLLDDLFNKTKAAPCIYWLPLTEEQFTQREAARQERMKEREKRRKAQQEEEEKKREEERKERIKAGSSASGERGEGDRDRERDRERGRDRDRDREGDKRREGSHRRPGGSSAGVGRRSRSRSDPPPRDRRR
ncbi:hypothetical protein J4Q44_G00272190 [Coregonus suidteri]|uniref:SAP domain-containing protein n=1 Tax=Coregonus suidteri TaxID=861788 RepID=A0AAN8L6Y3_9TELE